MDTNNPISMSIQNAYEAVSKALDALDQAGYAGLKIHPSISNKVVNAQLTLSEALKDLSVTIDLNTCVRDFYLFAYPTDDMGPSLRPDVTLKDVVSCINSGKDLYDMVGQSMDTVIRERIFTKVAELLDVDYLSVYNKWVDPKKHKDLPLDAAKAAPKRSLADQILTASQSAASNAAPVAGKEATHEH